MVSTQREQLPLLIRQPSDHIAIITRLIPSLGDFLGEVSATQFLQQVKSLSALLPDHQYVINLCDNRYLFTLTLCAAILREQTNLLPPNKKPLTQSFLYERYEDVYIAHDGVLSKELASIPDINCLDLDLLAGDEAGFDIPLIDKSHIAAITFTSGSTGSSQPNIKTWETIFESTKINAAHMLRDKKETLYQLATVPPQHMWGLETSVMLPLFSSVCVMDSKPLYPQDILSAVAQLPKPRMMVSTPVHLRAMHISGLEFPLIDLVLCATSPLSKELASQVEALFTGKSAEKNSIDKTGKPDFGHAELREVFGCSEVGSMALRATAHEEPWRMFDGIKLSQFEGDFIVSTAYLSEPVYLQDRLIINDDGRFTLDGRASDLVDIAGKRGSLSELNKVLFRFSGLVDGIIFLPENTHRAQPLRLAALVSLKDGFDVLSLKRFLSEHFDNAFIPRPIVEVSALPREENGKLSRKVLDEFYEKVKPRK